jgi:hypothetical protein
VEPISTSNTFHNFSQLTKTILQNPVNKWV